MAMNRAQFRRNLQLGMNSWFGLEYKQHPQEWKELFDVESSDKAYEEDALMTGFGAAPVKAEGAGVSYDEGAEAWVARYVHETVALAFSITQEAVEDGLYGNLGTKYSRALARSMIHTKEVKGANVFNNAFSASALGGDGKVLCATDHPLQGGGVLANTFATAAQLAEASLEDALTMIGDFVDDRVIPIAAQGVSLHVPTELNFVAKRLLDTPNRPGTADNDINAIRSMGLLPKGYSVNHRFTSASAWFIRTDVSDGLRHFNRKPLARGMEGDFETGNMRYKARERYSFGWTDPRCVVGTTG